MSFWEFFKFHTKAQRLLLRGVADLKQKRYREAITSFTEVIARKPNHVWSYSFRGDCYKLLGDAKRAFDDYECALKLNPKHGRTLFNRGVLHLHLGDHSKAIGDFTLAIENQYDAFYARAIAYMQNGRLDLAWDDISEASRRNPMTTRLLVTRAEYYHRMDRTEEAIEDLLKALEIDNRYASAHNNLAWYLATSHKDNLRNGAKALKHALKAVGEEKHPYPAYVGTLAAAYAETGNFKEAIIWATKFLESDPPEENIEPAKLRLALYRQGKAYREKPGQYEIVRDNRTPKA